MQAPLIRKILYATDLSLNANKAAVYALSFAHEYHAALTVINVIPDIIEEMSVGMGYDLASHFGAEKLASFYVEGLTESKKVVVERIHSLCKDAGSKLPKCPDTPPDVDIRVGHPVEQIVLAAKEGEFDLIVLGAKGHTMLDDILIGSVARGVVKKSTIPVLTIPLPGD